MFLRVFGVFTGRGRRVPRKGFTQLTSKLGPKGYYRGKGVPSVGHHTRKGEAAENLCMCGPLLIVGLANTLCFLCAGGYIILKDRLPNYVVPDLTGFTVRAHDSWSSAAYCCLMMWLLGRSSSPTWPTRIK